MNMTLLFSSEETSSQGRTFRQCSVLTLSICLFVVFFAAFAWGAIPAGECTVLQNLYTSTNGAGWTNSTNWNSSTGTECTWYGVACDAGGNHVTGISLYNNHLAGTLPSLSGLTSLQTVEVNINQLTGSIPALSALTNLQYFYASDNQLTGSIPSLSGLANLKRFYVINNQLTGSIPSLSGLINLQCFDVSMNQLTGSIPSLSGLTNLQYFAVYNNQLTGSIPSLSGLTNLHYFRVNQNYLSGDVPAVPSPNNLASANSDLCPNDLNATSNSAWDAATGKTPWYQNCTTGPAKFSVNYAGNGNIGGSLPDTGSIYTTGVTVTIHGNTGALYRTGYSFNGWNTAANGSGKSYVGGDTFVLGSVNVVLNAQWTATSASPVRIYDSGSGYSDIQDAYSHCADGDTIEAWDGLRGQNLLFNDPISVKLIGGYNSTFTTNSGATLVSGNIEISSGSVEIAYFIIR